MNKGQKMRFSDEELSTIKALFADNEKALSLMRKVFLPELTTDVPFGQNIDLWMTIKVEDMSTEQAIINLKARNTLINHVEQCLMQLQTLAGVKTESVDETKAKLAANSAK